MKKIMFDDKYGLTKAVLEGRKTMTRRLPDKNWRCIMSGIAGRDLSKVSTPYKVGEVVAVAQAYKDTCWTSPVLRLKDKPGWSNKMFVYADLMPHQIRITNVRVKRLQDITDEDCLKEGVFLGQFHTYSYVGRPRCPFGTPREAFASLIDRLSGKGTWKSNPWVFVYEFELVK